MKRSHVDNSEDRYGGGMSEAVRRPSRAEALRIAAVGLAIPAIAVAASWWIPSTWTDLPAEVPVHWQGDTPTSFGDPASALLGWSLGVSVVAAICATVTLVTLIRIGWSTATRLVIAIAASLSATIAGAQLLQFGPMRGLDQAAEVSPGPSIAMIVVGAPALVALLFLALPRSAATRP